MHQYTPLSLLVPAGTPASSPAAKTWTLYPGYVHSFRIRIPPGHGSNTGVRLVYQGTPIIPFDAASYLTGGGQTFEIPFADQIMNRGLVVQGFNTDKWDHTFFMWADVNPHLPGTGKAAPATPAAGGLSAQQLAALTHLGAAS